ncbi:Kynurenine formamidase [Ophidiomyces ophidiicola]|nr:Kynurenine formamidase [Ophidiomyces ophidiicola]KAI1930269.1 Kynurenine formamidase [Ophidiomyces ophidiicola]KAI1968120.1 Kynurenine formamidase [Ophidiomyces ophidiicola]KAI1975579.1 Kynurenine formamidase [Ophidiomyces ophidiicola]KAI2004993.1 Kynurenine formamidase [Ophidiomyces ophidiicola]
MSIFKEEYTKYASGHVLYNTKVYSPEQPCSSGPWIIYIHGGAWRDPEILASSFDTTVSHLLDDTPGTPTAIAGLASIDYRLTRYHSFPQDPATTDPQELRDATHPDHVHDVLRALAHLQRTYGFGERYMLVGHSCGATLALQTVMQRVAGAADRAGYDVTPPRAIVGVSGIYDLRLLRDAHQHPAYQEFLEAAFGKDEGVWDGVSPGRVGEGGIVDGWRAGRLLVLATSGADELVDPLQAQAMAEMGQRWKEAGGNEGSRQVVVIEDLKESHDGIWRSGELAGVIMKALEGLRRIEACG